MRFLGLLVFIVAIELPAPLAWLFDAIVMVEKGMTVDQLAGRGDNDFTRQVWTDSAWMRWLEQRPYTTMNECGECEELRVVGPDHRNVGGTPHSHDEDCPLHGVDKS